MLGSSFDLSRTVPKGTQASRYGKGNMIDQHRLGLRSGFIQNASVSPFRKSTNSMRLGHNR